jgi:hypothetical protein
MVVATLLLNSHPRLRPACGRQARVLNPEIQLRSFGWRGRVRHSPWFVARCDPLLWPGCAGNLVRGAE